MNKQLSFLCGILLSALSIVYPEQVSAEAGLTDKVDLLQVSSGEKKVSSDKKLSTPDKTKLATPGAQKGPTEITATREASFDEHNRKAIFVGDVVVKDPQFTLTSDMLTAFLKKQPVVNKPISDSGQPEAIKTSVNPESAPAQNDGGLERAVAEGNVVIHQEQINPEGGEPTFYIGKSEKADFDASTGDIKLSGWPQVQQGINTHIATDVSTYMIINRTGRMKTFGKSKTMIQDQEQDKTLEKK